MRRLLPIVALAAAALAAPGPAHASPPGTGVAVDQPDGFLDPLTGAGNHSGVTGRESVSEDGRYVVFHSGADGLAAGDDDRLTNIYRKDRRTGAVVLVSVATNGAAANAHSGDARISADGSRVAFASRATNLGGATDGESHVYLRNLDSGTTSLVSRADGVTGPPVSAFSPSLGANGRSVAFVTSASLHPRDGNGKPDVYVRRLDNGATVWASRVSGPNGGSGPGESLQPALDAAGIRVAFTTASPLDSADDNGLRDVYRRNLLTDLTEVISTSEKSKLTLDEHSDSPAITGDGLGVAFRSGARGLDGDLQDGPSSDIYVRHGNDVVLASGLGAGATDAAEPDIEGDRDHLRVAFSTQMEREPGSGITVGQVGVRDLVTGLYEPASVAPGGGLGDSDSQAASLAERGSEVVFATEASNLGAGSGGDYGDVVARDVGTDTTSLVSSGFSGPLAEDLGELDVRPGRTITPDGRYSVFAAGHDGLGASDRGAHVFRRDLRTGTTVQVDRVTDRAPTNYARDPSISADGKRVAFVTADPLVAADANGSEDVYVRDLAAGTTTLVSRGPGGAGGNGPSAQPVLDADGSRVAFTSLASDLTDLPDANLRHDVFVADLASGTTDIVSFGLKPSDGDSSHPAISADGRTIAFQSHASTLHPRDTDGRADVYVKTIGELTTLVLASVRSDDVHVAESSLYPTLSADGQRVAFESSAKLDGADTDTRADVYVRNVPEGTTMLASRATGPGGAKADSSSYASAISPDGRSVAFSSNATNLGGGAGDAYVRRLDDAVTARLGSGHTVGVTESAACVLLATRRHPAVRSSADFVRLVLQAVTDACDITTSGPGGGGPGGGGQDGAGHDGSSQDGGAQDGGGQGGSPVGGDPGGGTGAGGGAGGDRGTPRKAPVLSALSLTRSRVRQGRGTVVRFRLDRRATVTLDVQRRVKGRWAKLAALTRGGKAGRNSVGFTARLGRRALPRGSYRLVVRARDATDRSLVSKARSVRLRVVR